jgi:hypothetical protein
VFAGELARVVGRAGRGLGVEIVGRHDRNFRLA